MLKIERDPGSRWLSIVKMDESGFTVGDLKEALGSVPNDLLVTRYCDEVVMGLQMRPFGRSESECDHGRYKDQLPDVHTPHLALW